MVSIDAESVREYGNNEVFEQIVDFKCFVAKIFLAPGMASTK